jgi:S-adenosylmethionine synthetase
VAEALVAELDGVRAAECCLVSQIGRPIVDPQVADVRLRVGERHRPADFAPGVARIVGRELARLETLWRETLGGEVVVW